MKALKKPFSVMGLCKANADKKPKEWVCQHCQTQIFYANFKFDCMFFLVKIKFPAAHLRLKLSGSKELNVPVYTEHHLHKQFIQPCIRRTYNIYWYSHQPN